jgi:hypothetical protein
MTTEGGTDMSIRREDIADMNFDDVADSGRQEPVTPGEVLREEFMVPLGLTARALARDIGRNGKGRNSHRNDTKLRSGRSLACFIAGSGFMDRKPKLYA